MPAINTDVRNWATTQMLTMLCIVNIWKYFSLSLRPTSFSAASVWLTPETLHYCRRLIKNLYTRPNFLTTPALWGRTVTHRRWPRAAAWVWAHPWSPPRCFRSACRPSAGGSCTTPWTSAREQRREKKKDNWGYLQPGSKYLCSFYNNKPLWIVNERKWNSMGRKGGQGDTLIRQEVQGETRRESLTTCHTRRCGVGISVAKHFMHSYPTKSFKLKRQKTNQPSPILALSVWRCCH